MQCQVQFNPAHTVLHKHDQELFPIPCSSSSEVCRRFVRKTYCQGDILSWIFVRRFVRKTFCQHVFCETFCQEDILSVHFFCGRILHRRFVRKTNCQHFDHISGMLTLFMVCLRYIWYFDHISGMLTLLSQKWPKMNQNGLKWPLYDPKWPKMALKWPKMTKNKAKWPKNV